MLRKLLELITKVFQFKKTKVLTPKSREEELEILLNDDENFTNTERYLKGLIYKIIKKYNLNKNDEGEIYRKIIEALRAAASIYITKKHYEKGYKFSTYFTWWAKEVVEKEIKDSQNPS